MVAPWSSCQVINNGEACCLEPFFGWCFGFRSLQLDGVFLFISMYRLVTSVLDLSKKASVLDFFLSNKRKCYAFLFCFRWRHEVFTTFKIISAVWCSFDVNWKMIMRKTMYYLIMIVDAMMVINLLVNVFFFFFFFWLESPCQCCHWHYHDCELVSQLSFKTLPTFLFEIDLFMVQIK